MSTRTASRNVVRLLTELRRLGIRVWAEGDRLRISAARGVATPEIQRELSCHKDAILELLRADPNRLHSSELSTPPATVALSDEERHRILVEWNATEQEFPVTRVCITSSRIMWSGQPKAGARRARPQVRQPCRQFPISSIPFET